MNFKDFKNEIKKQIAKYDNFEITQIGSGFVWIGKKNGKIGNWSCHYEIIKESDKLFADIHFENKRKNDFLNVAKLVYEENPHHKKGVRLNQNGFIIEEESIGKCFGLFAEADSKIGSELEIIENELYNQAIDNLISEYKNLLFANPQLAIIDEIYKWELIEKCQKADTKTLINEVKKSNLVYASNVGTMYTALLKEVPETATKIIEDLISENQNLQERIENYQQSLIKVCEERNLQKVCVKDERTALTFLTCKYPEKYTFFKPSVYDSLCERLELSKSSGFVRVFHYISIIEDIASKIVVDNDLTSKLKEYLGSHQFYGKLIAQTLLWVCLPSKDDTEENCIMNEALSENLADLLKQTHNLILHGAPGTGKTHLAREIAKEMDAEVGFVQFHPSYDYTDFVEGLRPINDDNGGQIGFVRKDGVFKKFCKKVIKETVMDFLFSACNDKRNIKAYREEGYGNYQDQYTFSIKSINEDDNCIKIQPIGDIHGAMLKEIDLKIPYLFSLVCSRKTIKTKGDVKTFFQDIPEHSELYYFTLLGEIKKTEKKPFVFIIDEINRGEISKIFGELFFSIDPGYRGKDGLIQTQYQNLVPEGDTFSEGFYVPENVYIIGTMNDIDRNVESMDFAFRRRFTFNEIKATDTQQDILAGLDDSIREEAINRMNSLNDAISNIEGLSSAYHIGGAYFLKLKDFEVSAEEKFAQLWNYHLEGLLREYLRGMEDSESKLEDLKKAYNLDE